MKRVKMFALMLFIGFSILILSGCGGGGGSGEDLNTGGSIDQTSIPTETQEKVVLGTYSYPDESQFSEYNKALAESLEETQGALLQAVLLINTYIYTDPENTTFAEFQNRYSKAKEALEVLEDRIEDTLVYESLEEDYIEYKRDRDLTAENIISPHPFGGNRPIKAIMEKYQVSAQRAMDILQQMADEVTADAYKEAGDAYNVSQKRVEAAVESIKLVGTGVGAGMVIMAAAPEAVAITAGAAFIQFAGQTCKTVIALDHWAAAETGTKETPMPKIFVPIIDASEIVSIITLESGADVLVYGAGKLEDLIKSGGNSISFGAHDIEVAKIAQSMMDIPQDFDSFNYPAMIPGVYLTPDGQHISITAFPQHYQDIISKISPDGRLIDFSNPNIDTDSNSNITDTASQAKSCSFYCIRYHNESANYPIEPTVTQEPSINGGKFSFTNDWETQEFEFSTNLKLLDKPIDLGDKREIGSLEVSITHKLITTHSSSNILESFNMYLNGIGSSGGGSYPFFTEEEQEDIIFSPDRDETKRFEFTLYDNEESRQSDKEVVSIWAGILSPTDYQATFYIDYKCQ